MYAIQRQSDPVTVVDCALYCRLLNLREYHLVTGGADRVNVYRINKYVQSTRPDGSQATETRLENVHSVNLFGNIMSMTACLIPGHLRETLLIAFKEAKLSLLQWDIDHWALKTVSLHCFEDEVIKAGYTGYAPEPVVRADPESRCAAMIVYGRSLAVLPLLKDSIFDDDSLGIIPVTSSTAPSSSHLALTSYTVPLETIDQKLYNIADIVFLHGYYEPTLLFLYEPNPTSSGRAAVRVDSFCILAVSLSLKDRAHAVIWSVQNLPFDCRRVMAVPKPVSGVVIFGTNDIIYLNQSVPPYGIAVNANIDEWTAFPLKDYSDKKMLLDGSSSDFISSRSMVLCLKSGEVFIFTLLVDNMNSVKSVHLDKAASSVITSCVCKCGDGNIFLGSRLGNSLLLRYWERESFEVRVETTIEAPPLKIKDADGEEAEPTEAKRVRRVEDTSSEDVDIYGEVVSNKSEEDMRVSLYGFEVCDSLINIAPIRGIAVGDSVNIAEEFKTTRDPVVDMVFASGHGKNGALSVAQRTIRPHLITSSEIPNAKRLWTVGISRKAALDEGIIENAHKYLLISKEMDTMVLEMRSEITELEQSGFEMNERTIAVGNMGGDDYIVQVTPHSIILLHDAERVQQIPLETTFPISQASISDPFVILLTDNGEILLAIFDSPETGGTGFELRIETPRIQQNIPATAACVYCDVSGLFTTTTFSASGNMNRVKDEHYVELEFGVKDGFEGSRIPTEAIAKVLKSEMTIDDEDALLYGDDPEIGSPVKSGFPSLMKPAVLSASEREESIMMDLKPNIIFPGQEVEPTHWAIICRENGLLEIFTLPDFKLVYLVKRFPAAPRTVKDTDPESIETDRLQEIKVPIVRELICVGMGANQSRPHLFALLETEELLIYETFPYYLSDIADHLYIRFKKVTHTVIPRNRKFEISDSARMRGGPSLDAEYTAGPMFPFKDINGFSGLFISGEYPYWIIMTAQGILRNHPMIIDGPIQSFAAFHNVNCHHGFIYLNSGAEMRICQLPANIVLDHSCPVLKHNFKSTIHHVAYLTNSGTYALSMSVKRLCNTVVTLLGDEKQFETIEKEDKNFIFPTINQFSVALISPESWEEVPSTRIELQEFESVTELKEIQLKSEGTLSGMQNYLAIGTIWNYGEEVLIRGRIFICEEVEVVPEPGQPLTKTKLKTLYCKEQKGPVTCMCSVLGYLLTGMGQKVYIWLFKDNDLVGISFLDMQMYIHRMTSIRSIILVGDVFNSVSMLRYQESCKALSLVCRDLRKLHVMSVEFLVDGRQLGFLATDEDKNLYIYQYQPENRESYGGSRFIRRADIYLGGGVNALYRLHCHISDPVVENKLAAINRHMTQYGTLDGALGHVLPLAEKTFRRLNMLQSMLSGYLPHCGGLNPRSYRLVKEGGDALVPPQKNILDGDLIMLFMQLSVTEKFEVSKRIGTTKEQIMDDLLELLRLTTHY